MPPRSRTFVRLVRALLASLIVLLAFEPPLPRVELTSPVAAAAVVDAPAKARLVRRIEAPRVASARPLATVGARLVARPGFTPGETLRPVRRLYVELCSLLC